MKTSSSFIKGLAVALASLAYAACGDGEECRVESMTDGGAQIVCDDGSTTTIPRPASGTPPETCRLFDEGGQRFIRCGEVDYPIGTTSLLCSSGYYAGDLYLPARNVDQASALAHFEQSGCERLDGRLVLGEEPWGGEMPESPHVVSEIPASVLNLREISGGIYMIQVDLPSAVTFPVLELLGLSSRGEGGDGDGGDSYALYGSEVSGLRELAFPALVRASMVSSEFKDLESLEMPALMNDSDSDDPPLWFNVGGGRLKRLVLSSVRYVDFTAESGMEDAPEFSYVDLSSLMVGSVYFQLDAGATLLQSGETAMEGDLGGQVQFEGGDDSGPWSELWPSVEFVAR